jgi:hypothetical protein
VHIVLYHGIRYLPHNRSSSIKEILSSVFDEARVIDGRILGGQGKEVMFNSRTHIGDLEFETNGPLTSWVEYALLASKEWIDHVGPELRRHVKPEFDFDEETEQSQLIPTAQTPPKPLRFKDHSGLERVWEKALALNAWPLADGAVDRLPQDSAPDLVANASTSKKHPRDENESDVPEGSSASRRSRGERSIGSFAYSSTTDGSVG